MLIIQLFISFEYKKCTSQTYEIHFQSKFSDKTIVEITVLHFTFQNFNIVRIK